MSACWLTLMIPRRSLVRSKISRMTTLTSRGSSMFLSGAGTPLAPAAYPLVEQPTAATTITISHTPNGIRFRAAAIRQQLEIPPRLRRKNSNIDVVPEQVSNGLAVCIRQQAAAQPRRPDRVRLLEDESATAVVAVNPHRERKAEEKPQHPDHCSLHGANLAPARLVRGRVQSQPVPVSDFRNRQQDPGHDDGQHSLMAEAPRQKFFHYVLRCGRGASARRSGERSDVERHAHKGCHAQQQQ